MPGPTVDKDALNSRPQSAPFIQRNRCDELAASKQPVEPVR